MDRKKILVAIDQSKQSMDAVRFITKLLPPKKLEITLFMVFKKMPEVLWDQVRNSELDLDEDVLPITQIRVEECLINVPNKYENVLRVQFGDYRKKPELEDRIALPFFMETDR